MDRRHTTSSPGRMVVLRPGKGLPPLFVLPDLGGNLHYARLLVPHLAPERPVFGLGLPQGLGPEVSLETIASHCADLIEAADPGGRPLLLGHSFAGLLAFATATALQARGARPGKVVLIDTGAPPSGPRRGALRLRAALRRLWHREPRPAAGLLAEPGYARIDLTQHPESYRAIIAALYGAMTRYRPRPSAVTRALPVLLIRAAETARGHPTDYGWRRLAPERLVSLLAPGDHLSIIRESSFAAPVAHLIETHLDAL